MTKVGSEMSVKEHGISHKGIDEDVQVEKDDSKVIIT
jgi:hypothetical protein